MIWWCLVPLYRPNALQRRLKHGVAAQKALFLRTISTLPTCTWQPWPGSVIGSGLGRNAQRRCARPPVAAAALGMRTRRQSVDRHWILGLHWVAGYLNDAHAAFGGHVWVESGSCAAACRAEAALRRCCCLFEGVGVRITGLGSVFFWRSEGVFRIFRLFYR